MKKLLFLFFLFSLCFSETYLEDESVAETESTSQSPVFLDLIQKNFFSKSRKGRENTLVINYQEGNTYNIRTRFGMISSIIFTDETITQSILGDKTGFEVQVFGKDKPNLKSLIVIKPKLIGSDTNLFLVGESGRVYNFYLFSTDYKNALNPNLQVFVKTAQGKSQPPKAKIKEDKDYLVITNGVNTIKIQKTDIKKQKYTQKGEERLKAIRIFQDKKRTYFQYKADDGRYTFPVIYAVVNGYDSRVSTQVVGDYIIADAISEAWTLRNGESYVCVRFLKDE